MQTTLITRRCGRYCVTTSLANIPSDVYILKTVDRKTGITQLLKQFNLPDFAGKTVALKANFNSADPFPASTHLDTLRCIVENLQKSNAAEITLAERSGMGNTRSVLEQMGVFGLSEELGFKVAVLNEAAKDDWIKIEHKGTHWLHGFYFAKVFHDADKVINICCLKTHRFGGQFTLSLKNSVGMVAKKLPGSIYDYMWELHGSPYQRQMIAEINSHYNPDIVVLDGIKAFVSDGPEKGDVVEPNLVLASSDRITIDAIGVAILKLYGAGGKVGSEPVFEQDQIKRASELGFGVKAAEEIKLNPLNDQAKKDVERILNVLNSQMPH